MFQRITQKHRVILHKTCFFVKKILNKCDIQFAFTSFRNYEIDSMLVHAYLINKGEFKTSNNSVPEGFEAGANTQGRVEDIHYS